MSKNKKQLRAESRQARRAERRSKGQSYQPEPTREEMYDREFQHTLKKKHVRKPLEAKTQSQGLYISSILHSVLTFGIGPAGTGKTFVASGVACELLENGDIEKIIITRPAELCEEDFGALPGELEEKYAPYLQPFMDSFEKILGPGKTGYLIKRKVIDARPMGFMRGSTFENALVILDEAQNCSPAQMKMFLTRIGENSRVIVNGDIEQADIKGLSGLEDGVNRMEGAPGVAVVEFDEDDCVRHGLVKEVLKRYRN